MAKKQAITTKQMEELQRYSIKRASHVFQVLTEGFSDLDIICKTGFSQNMINEIRKGNKETEYSKSILLDTLFCKLSNKTPSEYAAYVHEEKNDIIHPEVDSSSPILKKVFAKITEVYARLDPDKRRDLSLFTDFFERILESDNDNYFFYVMQFVTKVPFIIQKDHMNLAFKLSQYINFSNKNQYINDTIKLIKKPLKEPYHE